MKNVFISTIICLIILFINGCNSCSKVHEVIQYNDSFDDFKKFITYFENNFHNKKFVAKINYTEIENEKRIKFNELDYRNVIEDFNYRECFKDEDVNQSYYYYRFHTHKESNSDYFYCYYFKYNISSKNFILTGFGLSIG